MALSGFTSFFFLFFFLLPFPFFFCFLVRILPQYNQASTSQIKFNPSQINRQVKPTHSKADYTVAFNQSVVQSLSQPASQPVKSNLFFCSSQSVSQSVSHSIPPERLNRLDGTLQHRADTIPKHAVCALDLHVREPDPGCMLVVVDG